MSVHAVRGARVHGAGVAVAKQGSEVPAGKSFRGNGQFHEQAAPQTSYPGTRLCRPSASKGLWPLLAGPSFTAQLCRTLGKCAAVSILLYRGKERDGSSRKFPGPLEAEGSTGTRCKRAPGSSGHSRSRAWVGATATRNAWSSSRSRSPRPPPAVRSPCPAPAAARPRRQRHPGRAGSASG